MSRDFYFLVRPEGFEPPASCSVDRRSIQLSYGRIFSLRDSLSRTSNNYTDEIRSVQIAGGRYLSKVNRRLCEESKRVPVYVTLVT